MKHLSSALYILFLSLVATACTLYMDESDIPPVDRDDPAYVDQQTITDDNGFVRYKYAHNAIAVDDEVESYIPLPVENHVMMYFSDGSQDSQQPGRQVKYTCRSVGGYIYYGRFYSAQTIATGAHVIDCVLDSMLIKPEVVEHDADSVAAYSVVYFMEDTPEHLLPEVGEILVCSYREKFPDAFCHKVIQRYKHNGMWRCVCTGVAYDEAFEYFEADMNIPATIHPEDSTTDADTYFGNLLPEEADTESQARPAYDYGQTRGWFDGWETSWEANKLLYCGVNELTFSATALKIASGSVTFGGGLYAGPTVHIMWKMGPEEHTKFSVDIQGGVEARFMAKVALGCELDLPLSIPIFGEKIDLYVVGGELGVYATPFVSYERSVEVGIALNYGLSLEFGYEGYKNQKGSAFCTCSTLKNKGVDPVTIFKADENVKQTFKAGFKIEAGVGVKPGIALACGVAAYAQFSDILDKNKLTNEHVIDAEQSNKQAITFKTEPYAKADADLIFISHTAQITGPAKTQTLHIQMYPDIKEYKFFKSNASPREFDMGFTLNNQGILGWLLATSPTMRVYDPKTMKTVEEYKLKTKKDNDHEFYLTRQHGTNLKDNYDYKVQCFMKSTIGISEIMLGEFPVRFNSAEMRITNVELMQTNTTEGPFVRSVWGQPKSFKYRYRIRVNVEFDGVRSIREWKLHAYNLKLTISTDKSYTSVKEKATVDWYIYTNTKKTTIFIEPSLYLKDDNGNPISSPVSFNQYGGQIDLEYKPSLETLSPSWGNPDFDAGD